MRPRRRRDGTVRWRHEDVWMPDARRWRCRGCPNASRPPFKFYCSAVCREAFWATVPEFWDQTRRRILQRDGCCVLCGAGDGLEVDHIRPVALFPELEFDDGNLRTLCRACHRRHGAKPRNKRWRAQYGRGQSKLPEAA